MEKFNVRIFYIKNPITIHSHTNACSIIIQLYNCTWVCESYGKLHIYSISVWQSHIILNSFYSWNFMVNARILYIHTIVRECVNCTVNFIFTRFPYDKVILFWIVLTHGISWYMLDHYTYIQLYVSVWTVR